MAGIAGVIGRLPDSEANEIVAAMLSAMQCEPFHVVQQRSCEALGIAVGTVGVSGVEDAFVTNNEEGTITLAWAGECLIPPTTVDALRRSGHQLRCGGSDWMLHLYEEQGESCARALNGQFSAVFIDRRTNAIHLCTDRYGMGRVYYFEGPDAFYFASEAKALLRVLPETRRFNDAALLEFLEIGCVFGEETLFKGIRLVPAAAWWRLERDRRERRQYFAPSEWQSAPKLREPEFFDRVSALLNEVVPEYSNGKVGLSLTGGLDTRLIVACWPSDKPLPTAFTFEGLAGTTLDTETAAAVAAAIGMEHHTIRLGPNFLSDFPAWADDAVYTTDGTLGVTGAHELYLNKQARQLATIRLTGNFGSEILRRVSTMKPLGLRPAVFAEDVRRDLRAQVRPLTDPAWGPVSRAAFVEVPRKLYGNFAASRRYVRYRTPYLDNRIVELAHRAPLRVPLDGASAMRVVAMRKQTVSRIPTDMAVAPVDGTPYRRWPVRFGRKLSFKCDYWYGEGMPGPFGVVDPLVWRAGVTAGLLGRHKYLHYRSWFRRDLVSYVQERLASRRVQENALWNRKSLESMERQHRRGTVNWSREIDMVLTIDAIERRLLHA